MKVGIITLWIYSNFGSKLQAYALQRYLIKKGFDAVLRKALSFLF